MIDLDPRCRSLSDPPIVHNNGSPWLVVPRGLNSGPRVNLGPLAFDVLSQRLFACKAMEGALAAPSNLEILLCHNYKTEPIAQRSLRYLGIENFVVLASQAEKWSHFEKPTQILNHLRKGGRSDYVLFVDSSDVLFTGDLHVVVDRFVGEFSCDLVFGAEKSSWPSSSLWTMDDPLLQEIRRGRTWSRSLLQQVESFEKDAYPRPFQHLNSGCWIGRREGVLAFHEQLLDLASELVETRSDQYLWRELHRRAFPRIQIDSQRRLFYNLFISRRTELRSHIPVTSSQLLRALFRRCTARA